jgi:hypothetical protein
VVINRAGDPVHDFDDTNIIGGINLSGTGLADFYNSVEVKFPHRDLADQMDFIKIEIPAEDRNVNEPDNCLTIDLPVMNEPIQAQIVGLIELKQSRLDKIITFRTDYSKINLQAGQIVTVTNSVYGFTNKEFRIIRMEEADADGTIVIDITALEYSDSVYDLSDLYRYTRTNADGLITQGMIGKPGTPVITKFEDDPNPRIEIASRVPDGTDPTNLAGIVEGMEFWSSIDNSEFTLLGTLTPFGTDVFEANEIVTFTYNNAEEGNLYVKTRCINSTTSSEYSTVASTVYSPTQITDAIQEGTTGLLNTAGGAIATQLALTALLKGLDTYMNGNSNLANSVGSQISSASSSSRVIQANIDLDNLPLIPEPTVNDLNLVTAGATLAWTVTTAGYYYARLSANFGIIPASYVENNLGIRYIHYTGGVFGAGDPISNVPEISGGYTTTWHIDSFSDLDCENICYLNPGTYHSELYYGSSAANTVQLTFTVDRITAPLIVVVRP